MDEVLDLILSAAKGKAPGKDGITVEVLGSGRPMPQLLQPLFAGVSKEPCLLCGRGRKGIMATIPSGKNKTRGVMLNDHVEKILGRWIRPKILQIEPLMVARSQATGFGPAWSSHDPVHHACVFLTWQGFVSLGRGGFL